MPQKPNRKKSGDKQAIAVVIGLGVVGLVMVAYLTPRKKGAPEKPDAGSVGLKAVEAAPKAVKSKKTLAAKSSVELAQAQRQLFESEMVLGIGKMPLPGGPDDAFIPVTLRAKPSCDSGDVDLMRIEATSGAGHFLLTLEALAGKMDGPLDSQTLSIGEIEGGLKTKLKIGSVGEGIPMGIFLCNDTSGKGRCRGKKVVEYNERMNQRLYQKKGDAPLPDTVFFFQYVQADRSSLAALDASGVGNPAVKKQFASYAGNKFGDPAGGEAIAGKVAALGSSSRSVPLKLEKEAVTIELPVMDAAACSGAQEGDGGKDMHLPALPPQQMPKKSK